MKRRGFGTFVWIFSLLVVGIYFASVVYADKFDNPELRDVWTWDDADNDDEWSLTEEPGWFRFKVGGLEDTWNGVRGDMPMLLQPSPIGDYSMETHLKIDEQNQQTYGCLVVWQDGNNWIHHELIDDGGARNGPFCQYWPGGVALKHVNVEPDDIYLKVERKGDDWHLFYKLEEEDDWTFLDKAAGLKYDDPHWVGIGAKTWGGPEGPVVADFDYFRCEELGEVKVAVEPDSKLATTWARIKVDT